MLRERPDFSGVGFAAYETVDPKRQAMMAEGASSELDMFSKIEDVPRFDGPLIDVILRCSDFGWGCDRGSH